MGSLQEAFANGSQPADLDAIRIAAITERLGKSALGRELLDNAAANGYTILLASRTTSNGACNNQRQQVILNSNVGDDQLVSTLAHELRHVQQNTNGAPPLNGNLDTRSYVMINRALEADANAAAGMACWQLANAGDKKPLGCNSPLVVAAISDNMNAHPDTPCEAMSAAFKSWYTRPNLMVGYELQHVAYLGMVEEKGAAGQYPFAGQVQAESLAQVICAYNGQPYLKEGGALLETPEYLGVDKGSKQYFEKFFADRQEKYGQPTDASVAQIPVRDYGLGDGVTQLIAKRQEEAQAKIAALKIAKQKFANDPEKMAKLTALLGKATQR